MIWRVPAELKQIHDQGRHFPWPRPECCPRCRNWRVWARLCRALFRWLHRSPAGEVLSLSGVRLCDYLASREPFSTDSQPAAGNSGASSRSPQPGALAAVAPGPLPLAALAGQSQTAGLGAADPRLDSGAVAGFEELLLRGQVPVARVS
jgi:hypothetical protein